MKRRILPTTRTTLPTTRNILATTLALTLTTTAARGDGLLFSYDGDILPGLSGSRLDIDIACSFRARCVIA